MSAFDTQVGGSHYKDMAIQPMEFSMANSMDACQHTIIKYVSRFRDKGGVQDLVKAKHVIDMLIEFENDNAEPELFFGKYDVPEQAAATQTGQSVDFSELTERIANANTMSITEALATLLAAGVITEVEIEP